jgi:hypothetical protein
MNNKKNFIAQQSGPRTVKVFDTTTGQLYRIINVGGVIATPPSCTSTELAVGVYTQGKSIVLKTYSVPGFSLKKIIPL